MSGAQYRECFIISRHLLLQYEKTKNLASRFSFVRKSQCFGKRIIVGEQQIPKQAEINLEPILFNIFSRAKVPHSHLGFLCKSAVLCGPLLCSYTIDQTMSVGAGVYSLQAHEVVQKKYKGLSLWPFLFLHSTGMKSMAVSSRLQPSTLLLRRATSLQR